MFWLIAYLPIIQIYIIYIIYIICIIIKTTTNVKIVMHNDSYNEIYQTIIIDQHITSSLLITQHFLFIISSGIYFVYELEGLIAFQTLQSPYIARRSFLSIFPEAVFGIWFINSTPPTRCL